MSTHCFWGDFNLTREKKDESSNQGDPNLMDLFNNFIEHNNLREVKRSGASFTRTNRQANPIQSNNDKDPIERMEAVCMEKFVIVCIRILFSFGCRISGGCSNCRGPLL